MKNTKEKIAEGGITALLIIGIIALIYGLSWAGIVFLIWLITLCFGLEFNLLIATGIWLIILIARSVFSAARNRGE